jgi:hypothetical protein
MNGNSLKNKGVCLRLHPEGCINEAGRNGAGNTDTALDITACRGGRTMPVEANIPILSVSAIANNSGTWQPIGLVAARIIAGVRRG